MTLDLQQQAAGQAEATGFSTMAELLPGAPITDADLPDRPTVNEVARWLRKSRNTVYGWARSELIPCVKVGRSYLFSKAELVIWARSKKKEAA